MNVFCIYNISVRRTVIELQPFIRLVIRTRAIRLQGHPRTKLMVPLERASMSFFLEVSKECHRTHRFRYIGDFMVEPFLDALPVAQWGHCSLKVKVDLDPPGMGSYSTLIVTMGLSSTVYPQCTPRQTDGRTDRQTDMLLTIIQPILCFNALHALASAG